MINVINDTITVNFSTWDAESYKVFLQSKKLPEYNLEYDWKTDSYTLKTPARFAHVFGLDNVFVDRGWLPFNEKLFDYQLWTVRDLALPAKRFAVWFDTGLGKCFVMLELARQVSYKTQGKVLLIVPLNLIEQTIDESKKFYSDYCIHRIETREDLKFWCKKPGPEIGIVNPEKFIPRRGDNETISECQYLAGVCLDEASILKSGGGTIKWALIKSCRGIEYKYTFTATPAPNETMEYASQGSFLEKLRSEGEIIWTFFTRMKNGEWKIKDHAKDAFYRFMSGWSIYMRNPKKYGFADNLKDLPRPVVKEYHIKPTLEQLKHIRTIPDKKGQLQLLPDSENGKLEMTQRIKYSEIAKGFMYVGKNDNRKTEHIKSSKPQFCADLIMADLNEGLKVLVWTIFDEESSILFNLLKDTIYDVQVLTGSIPKSKRTPIIEDFRTGKSDCLITKASLLGYGLNFQICGSNVISGFNDSEEQRYQLERRSYRYGQTKAVKMHYPYIPELEGVVFNNIQQKRERIAREVSIMEDRYIKAMGGVYERN